MQLSMKFRRHSSIGTAFHWEYFHCQHFTRNVYFTSGQVFRETTFARRDVNFQRGSFLEAVIPGLYFEGQFPGGGGNLSRRQSSKGESFSENNFLVALQKIKSFSELSFSVTKLKPAFINVYKKNLDIGNVAFGKYWRTETTGGFSGFSDDIFLL